jgi:hypothetical protein
MKEVRRMDLVTGRYGGDTLCTANDGDYVSSEDYDALMVERDELLAALANVIGALHYLGGRSDREVSPRAWRDSDAKRVGDVAVGIIAKCRGEV